MRAGIGYVPQEHSVFARLSVRDNLAVGSLASRKADAVDQVLTIFPKLGQRLDQPAGTLSGGERKMLAIGRAMLGDPKLLLLDEPTEGVWIGVIEEITERLIELAKNIAVIIVEQHLDLGFARRGLRLRARPRQSRAARRGRRGEGQSGAAAVSGAVGAGRGTLPRLLHRAKPAVERVRRHHRCCTGHLRAVSRTIAHRRFQRGPRCGDFCLGGLRRFGGFGGGD